MTPPPAARPSAPPSDPTPPEALAQRFHEAYERLAPSFGYATREASAKPWAEVPENNRRLMTAVCAEILASQRAARARAETEIHGVTFLILRDDCVLMERCPKKAAVLGVGEWFIPGGKLEPGESDLAALMREASEELGIAPTRWTALPILEGSPVPPGPRGLFLMRPFLVTEYESAVPTATLDEGVPLRWVPIAEALASPVPQVRMMVAAARASGQPEAVSP